ncbi:glycosyltransferase [Solwaraspora sp. WMMD406]|uniref:glycosyltransferase n=1 Tax=Solwaraspora sp. WMMD406 TaxID=3016095 RepID=UPI002416ECD1|nr:glycosyltransferase [Solwaraspora sp. WMMD406]MDG4766599.1 glycosyltransferase [Solwaraspora sp. WMMD406]
MRIAMISEHASPLAALGGVDAGGQNTHVAELSTALAAEGHEVRVYTRRDAPDLPELAELDNGVSVVHVPAGPAEHIGKDDLLPHMAEFSHWLVRQWGSGEWTPAVAHAHFWMSGLAAVTAGRLTEVPVVQTYHALGTVKRRHQGAMDTSPPRRIGYERALGRSVDRVIAQSQDEVAELIRMGVPRARLSVVPSGVNEQTFAPDGPVADRIPGRPRVLTVGRLVARKGFQDVVRAMQLVPDAECVIVGGPPGSDLDADPQACQLRRLAEDCGVGDRVRLVGAVPREEMPRWYRSADVLVAAPWYEPFGLTPLEAMACGVPVIGTAVGGLTDTVVDGLTGDLVAPRDPRALGMAMRRLLSDRVRRFAYATAALDRARQCYSWRRAAEQLVAVYATVSGVRQPSRVVA